LPWPWCSPPRPLALRTKNLTIPLGESPVYVTGAKGLKAVVRPDPGW
jgi:hypothetical protein